MTEEIFRQDSYCRECEATVVSAGSDGIVLDRTVFYPNGGGQPGDQGVLRTAAGDVTIVDTLKGANGIRHVPVEGADLPAIGSQVTCAIDWARRYKLMRMHTACHLLSVVCSYPITGAAVGEDESRVDFDMSETIDKDQVTADLMKLVTENHPITLQWITDEELAANPGIVKSKNVRPPVGLGRVSLVCIGENSAVDSQPCGGTHVSETQEVGAIHIAKIEKKGKENRRFRIRFGAPDASA